MKLMLCRGGPHALTASLTQQSAVRPSREAVGSCGLKVESHIEPVRDGVYWGSTWACELAERCPWEPSPGTAWVSCGDLAPLLSANLKAATQAATFQSQSSATEETA